MLYPIMAWVDGSYKNEEINFGGFIIQPPMNNVLECWYGTIKKSDNRGGSLAEINAVFEGAKRLLKYTGRKVLVGDDHYPSPRSIIL